jgi:gluconokinase
VILIVAGVSGSGKTTVGESLARRLAWVFIDGDSLHPARNIAKMKSGIPLTEQDRAPWLHAVADRLDAQLGLGRPAIVACSALKRSYRDLLLHGRPAARIAFLQIDHGVAAARLANRHGHFFDPELLDSQFADLELPDPAEDRVMTVPVTGTPNDIADKIIIQLACS